MAASRFRQPSILPGFGLTLGFTTFFLSALVLLPLAALVYKTTSMTWADFIGTVLDERLTVACGQGALRLLELQREGRKPQPAAEFLRGLPLAPGTRLA